MYEVQDEDKKLGRKTDRERLRHEWRVENQIIQQKANEEKRNERKNKRAMARLYGGELPANIEADYDQQEENNMWLKAAKITHLEEGKLQ